MGTVTSIIRPIIVSILFGLTGCFSLSRNAPPVQHYVLGEDGALEISAPGPGARSGTTVGVRTSRLAGYLATPFIVVRRGPNRIEFSDFDRWGEDLARGIGHTTADYMAARAPSLRVESAPWAVGLRPTWVIQLDVMRFEGVAPDQPEASEGEAWMVVAWEIFRDGVPVRQGTTERRESGWTVGDYIALVGLLDGGLDALSEELLRGMESAGH